MNKISQKKLFILLPALNEGKVIGGVIDSIRALGFENILIVDDGSKDNTSVICRKKGVFLLRHSINRGAGAAIQTGLDFLKKTDAQAVLLMDADGQHHSEDIDKMVERMRQKSADLLIGSRFMGRNDIPVNRRFFNAIANVLTNIFSSNNYSDSQSGFRLLNRKAIESFNLQIDHFGFCTEMIWQAEKYQLKIDEIPIQVTYNTYSMSKGQQLATGIKTAFNLIFERFFGI